MYKAYSDLQKNNYDKISKILENKSFEPKYLNLIKTSKNEIDNSFVMNKIYKINIDSIRETELLFEFLEIKNINRKDVKKIFNYLTFHGDEVKIKEISFIKFILNNLIKIMGIVAYLLISIISIYIILSVKNTHSAWFVFSICIVTFVFLLLSFVDDLYGFLFMKKHIN